MNLKNLQVKFQSDGHTYEVGGQLLTGVTTILQVRQKDFLKWWTVKLMWENLTGKFSEIVKGTEKEFEDRILEAKKAHTVKSKEALVSGHIAHDYIKHYIKEKLGIGGALVMPKDEKAVKSIDAFLEWEKQHKVKWLASELVLASVINMFAGTVDAVAEVDDVLTVVDFKTSSQISDEYFLQTSAYWLLLDENLVEGEKRPEQRLILRIPKDGSEFEAKLVETPLDFDCATFLRCREIHRWNLLVKKVLERK